MKKYIVVVGLTLVLIAASVVWLRAAPSVDAVAATPAYIVINVRSPVLFTAQITDPSVIATGVNLLSTDVAGKTLATVGKMRDDGSKGDAKAGDKIFSFRVNFNEELVGEKYYRVSAAFRGVLRRTQSSVITVHVDPFPLPPDPGEAGKQTLDGIDVNANGVRDDVERYIGLTYQVSPSTREALHQFVVPHQQFLHDQDDKASALAHNSAIFAAWNCLRAIRPTDADVVIDKIEDVLLNSADRALASNTASRQLHGTALPRLVPGGVTDACQ